MTVARFWTHASSEVKITPPNNGGNSGGGNGNGNPGRGNPGNGNGSGNPDTGGGRGNGRGPGNNNGNGGGGAVLLPTFVSAGVGSATGFSGTPSPFYPDGIENGDLLIYVLSKNTSDAAVPDPTNWTACTTKRFIGTLVNIQLFYRFHDGTTPATTTVGTSTSTTARIFAFRGVSQVDPFGVEGWGTSGDNLAITMTGLSSDAEGSLLFFAATHGDDANPGTDVILAGSGVTQETNNGLWIGPIASGGDRTTVAKLGRAASAGPLTATMEYNGISLQGTVGQCSPINAA